LENLRFQLSHAATGSVKAQKDVMMAMWRRRMAAMQVVNQKQVLTAKFNKTCQIFAEQL